MLYITRVLRNAYRKILSVYIKDSETNIEKRYTYHEFSDLLGKGANVAGAYPLNPSCSVPCPRYDSKNKMLRGVDVELDPANGYVQYLRVPFSKMINISDFNGYYDGCIYGGGGRIAFHPEDDFNEKAFCSYYAERDRISGTEVRILKDINFNDGDDFDSLEMVDEDVYDVKERYSICLLLQDFNDEELINFCDKMKVHMLKKYDILDNLIRLDGKAIGRAHMYAALVRYDAGELDEYELFYDSFDEGYAEDSAEIEFFNNRIISRFKGEGSRGFFISKNSNHLDKVAERCLKAIQKCIELDGGHYQSDFYRVSVLTLAKDLISGIYSVSKDRPFIDYFGHSKQSTFAMNDELAFYLAICRYVVFGGTDSDCIDYVRAISKRLIERLGN